MSTLAGWGHPILGALAVLLIGRAAGHAMRIRRGGAGAGAARRRHAWLAPRALATAALAWVTGLGGVWLFHEEIEAGASGHFQVGSAMLALLGLNAVLSRWIGSDARARALHPWVGAVVLLLAGIQVFLGLQLLRQ